MEERVAGPGKSCNIEQAEQQRMSASESNKIPIEQLTIEQLVALKDKMQEEVDMHLTQQRELKRM